MTGRLLLLAMVATAVPSAARADIWECRRPDGSMHFTNVRPAGAAARHCRLVIRERQRPADRPAAEGASFSPPPGGGGRSNDPQRYQRYDSFIAEAARLYQLPPQFIRAVIRVESDFNPHVVSSAGAMGLMQLMPRTAANMGVRDPFDPRQNILGGTRYLRVLANMFNGDLVLTVAAYNAGENAVVRYRGVPPYDETRRYVGRVLRHYYGAR
jgi:soluble lytic murein transglycosylase-like protein